MLTNFSTKSIDVHVPGTYKNLKCTSIFSKESLYIDTEFTLHDIQKVFQFSGIGQRVPVGEVTVNGRDRASLGQVLPHQTRPLVINLEHTLVTQHLPNRMKKLIFPNTRKSFCIFILIGVKDGINYLELFRMDRFLHAWSIILWANYYLTVLCVLNLNRVTAFYF